MSNQTIDEMVDALNEVLDEDNEKEEKGEEEIEDDFDKENIRHVEQIDPGASSTVIEEVDIPFDSFLFIEYVTDKLIDIVENTDFEDSLTASEEDVIEHDFNFTLYKDEDEDPTELDYGGGEVTEINREEVGFNISPLNIEMLFWKMIIFLEILHDNDVVEETEDNYPIYSNVVESYFMNKATQSEKVDELTKKAIQRAHDAGEEYDGGIIGEFEQKEIIPDHDSPSSMKNKVWRTIRFCFEANKELNLGLKTGKKINNQIEKWREAGFDMTPSRGVWEYK